MFACMPRYRWLSSLLNRSISGSRSPERFLVELAAAISRVPVPALSSALAYLDSYRSARLPANLIQAQRDLFGAHTYERIDKEGSFHTEWESA